jgi:hypothetical protein
MQVGSVGLLWLVSSPTPLNEVATFEIYEGVKEASHNGND